jgi:hypothetical protein
MPIAETDSFSEKLTPMRFQGGRFSSPDISPELPKNSNLLRKSFPFAVTETSSNINSGCDRILHVMKRTFKVKLYRIPKNHLKIRNFLHSSSHVFNCPFILDI